jgi:putative transposase
MFNAIVSGKSLPKYLSSDNDPLFLFHRWKANLRIIDVEEIKTVHGVPTSHPFVERLIGSIRSELLDHTLFWTASDLENKLHEYQCYYNKSRAHSGRDGRTPIETTGSEVVDINKYRWEKYCRGLFELPIAA